ncbi:MAG: hypothetical protein LBP73_06380 [Clostridiales Family XIII bacterium]|jgi:hypothetical protein|nr:hypothetical protein [Clostridiales Family XIII bacterium]
MQAIEGYFDNGRFFAIGRAMPVPERRRVIITVLDEPIQQSKNADDRAWLDEFHRLTSSNGEELRDEDFPRMRFGRELINFSEED